jgi:hypothetical protein
MDLTKPIDLSNPLKPMAPIVIPEPVCAKCGGKMEEGFLLDCDYRGDQPSHWIAGKPEYGMMGNLKTSTSVLNRIHAFACHDCGYLESYIFRPKPEAPAS